MPAVQWTDKNDDVAGSARDLKHSAENKVSACQGMHAKPYRDDYLSRFSPLSS